MQVESLPANVPQVQADLPLQLAHRLSVVATLLLVTVIGLSLKGTESRSLTWAAVIAADAAVLMTVVSLVLAYYRSTRSLRELLVLLAFTLLLAHLTVWMLIDPTGIAGTWQKYGEPCWAWVVDHVFSPVFGWADHKLFPDAPPYRPTP